MKKTLTIIILILSTLFMGCDTTDFDTIVFEDCEYIYNPRIGKRSLVHKGNCSSPIHYQTSSPKDTIYLYGVSIRYGTRDTIYQMYPIDSSGVVDGYLKTNRQ